MELISPHCPPPPAARQARVNLGMVWTHRLSLCSRLFWAPAWVLWFFLPKSHFAAHSRGGQRGELLKSRTMEDYCKGRVHLSRGGIPRVGSGPKNASASQLCYWIITQKGEFSPLSSYCLICKRMDGQIHPPLSLTSCSEVRNPLVMWEPEMQ